MRLLMALALLMGCLCLTSAVIIERGMESLEDDGWIFDPDEDGSDSQFSNEVFHVDDLSEEGEKEGDPNSDHIYFIGDETDEGSSTSSSEDSSRESSESGESGESGESSESSESSESRESSESSESRESGESMESSESGESRESSESIESSEGSKSDASGEDWEEGDGFRKTVVDMVKEKMANMSHALSTLLNQTYHKMLELPPPSSAGNQRTQLVVDFLEELKETFGDDEHIQPHLELRTPGHRHHGHGPRHFGHGHRPHGHGHNHHGHGHNHRGHGHRPHGHGQHGHGHDHHGHGHDHHGHGHDHHGHGHNHHGHGHRPQGSGGNRMKFDLSRFNKHADLSQMVTRNKRSAVMWGGFQRMGGGHIQAKESLQLGDFPRFQRGKPSGKDGFGQVKETRRSGNGKFGDFFKGKSGSKDGFGKGHKQWRFGKGKFSRHFNGKHSGKGFQKQPSGHWNADKFHQGQPDKQLNIKDSGMAALSILLMAKTDAISTLINDSCSTLQSLPAADNNEHSKASLQRKMFVMAFLGKYMTILKNSTDYKEESSQEEEGEEQWCIAKTEAMIQLINTTNQDLHMMSSEWRRYYTIIRAHFKGTMISESFLCEGYLRIVNVTEPVLRLVNHTYQKMLKLSSADKDRKTSLLLEFVMELEDTLDFRNLTRQIYQELYERHMKHLEKLGFKNPQGNQKYFWKKGRNHGKGDMAKHGGIFSHGFGKWQSGKNPAKGNMDYNKQQPWKPRHEGKFFPKWKSGGFGGGKKPSHNQWRPRKNRNHNRDYKGDQANKGRWMTNTDKTKKKPSRPFNWTNGNPNARSGKQKWRLTMAD